MALLYLFVIFCFQQGYSFLADRLSLAAAFFLVVSVPSSCIVIFTNKSIAIWMKWFQLSNSCYCRRQKGRPKTKKRQMSNLYVNILVPLKGSSRVALQLKLTMALARCNIIQCLPPQLAHMNKLPILLMILKVLVSWISLIRSQTGYTGC